MAMTAALVLLSACASQKSHAPPQMRATAPKAPAVKTHGKPVDNRRANSAATNKAGVAPGEVGYFLDVLQGRLRQVLDPAVVIGRDRGSIALDFPQDMAFAADETRLDDAGRALLLPLTSVLAEYRSALISVSIDAADDAAMARQLAQLRARAIERVLTDSGVAAGRIAAVVRDGAVRNGNLRVEILLAPEIRSE